MKRHRKLILNIKQFSSILLLFFSITTAANCQEEVLRQKAHDALSLLKSVKPIAVVRNNNPDAQWFPEAGLGLFMHWGIHSVAALEPSWAMMKNLPWAPDDTAYFDRNYYSLLWRFHPENYDPDRWMKAAKEAGMSYAVITAKHHDGYALWPGEYTNLGTKKYMDGRDLLKPYVEACRKYGLQVGFYFSPRDWSYPGFPVSMDFNNYGNGKRINQRTPEQNQHDYDKFFEYTAGQLSELLTRYGKIDLLWFDAVEWPDVKEMHTEQIYAWIRTLQPGIVINDRWDYGGGKAEIGDYITPETFIPEKAPDTWWESCLQWGSSWGYSPNPRSIKTDFWVMENLVKARAMGGNILLNIGPAPDGTMQPEFYERTAELAKWMTHSKKSLIGADPLKSWKEISNVPVTRKDNDWYLHILPGKQEEIWLKTDVRPLKVKLLQTNENIRFKKKGNTLFFDLPEKSNGLNDVIVVTWKDVPKV
ncbi:MAG: alpha-L-fucosidase [Bacteroidales bacterium]|nr:alpha-L-fucosidase [Bacteroidales bacterium]